MHYKFTIIYCGLASTVVLIIKQFYTLLVMAFKGRGWDGKCVAVVCLHTALTLNRLYRLPPVITIDVVPKRSRKVNIKFLTDVDSRNICLARY